MWRGIKGLNLSEFSGNCPTPHNTILYSLGQCLRHSDFLSPGIGITFTVVFFGGGIGAEIGLEPADPPFLGHLQG